MNNDIHEFLFSIGVSQSYTGYPYFISAVERIMEDRSRLSRIRRDIYLPLADQYNTSLSSVEKDIRTIRDVIIRNNGLKLLEKESGRRLYYSDPPFPKEVLEIFAVCFDKS